MQGLSRALLVVGVLNLIALGLIACGDEGRADGDLADRVAALEAWKLSVEERLTTQHNFAVSQVDLNTKVHATMQANQDVAVELQRRAKAHEEMLSQLTDLVKDILKRK